MPAIPNEQPVEKKKRKKKSKQQNSTKAAAANRLFDMSDGLFRDDSSDVGRIQPIDEVEALNERLMLN